MGYEQHPWQLIPTCLHAASLVSGDIYPYCDYRRVLMFFAIESANRYEETSPESKGLQRE